jgi:hypothetical protein
MLKSSTSLATLAALLLFAGTQAARADDQPFLTLYTTDIQPQGGREFEQWLKWKAGHANESFNSFESRSEIEYGFTDNVQGSLYLSYDWDRTRPHLPLGPADTTDAVGVSGELIWRVMNPYFDPFGLAFYVEPSISAEGREFETKILFQKNFLNDTLRWAVNVNFEDRWEKNPLGHFDPASALEFDTGVAYNVTPDFSVGLEFDNERGFDGLILGGSPDAQTDSYYLGPTIQYIGNPWAVTFGAQKQLAGASNPAGIPGNVVDGLTAGDEHFRLTLKVSRDF